MRVLILGGDGMLGHQFFKHFSRLNSPMDVRVTLRQGVGIYCSYGLFTSENAFGCVDVRSTDRVEEVFAEFRPEVVVNAVGIVKQLPSAKEAIPCIELNALLPHRLSLLCKDIGARLVQLSTDCVFSGQKGNYQESDPSDAEDLYGKTKFLGELHDKHCLTLRTSSIGFELGSSKGLLEWFLAQRGTVKGYRNAIFTGLTSMELARVLESLLIKHTGASGLYQVSGDRINKYDLLHLFRKYLHHEIEIIPDEKFSCDRSLDSSRFRREFGYTPPTWDAMIEELANSR